MSTRGDRSITLHAAGDLAPARKLVPAAPDTQQVWAHLRNADLATANLEIPLTNKLIPADKAITLRADPGLAPSLNEAGLNVVTVANNHALDQGFGGLSDTLSALEEAEVAAVGGGMTLEEAARPALISAGETTIAVLGLACTLPSGFAADPLRPGVAPVRVKTRFLIDAVTLDEQPGMAPWVETEALADDVRMAESWVEQARDEANLVVVHAHWGVPNGWCGVFQDPLADYQRPLGMALVDAGADLVVGHHPHVVHGVEAYNGGIIAYSLGNFLFHGMAEDGELTLAAAHPPYDVSSLKEGDARLAVILEMEWRDGGIESVLFRPTLMNARGEPEFASGVDAERVLSRLVDLSGRLGTRVENSNGVATLIL